MPRLRLHAILLSVSIVLRLADVPPLVASPLAPNVRASRSANGRFLVVTEHEYDNPDPNAIRRILRTSYQVFQLEPFLNTKDRLIAPVPFWSDSALSWRITLDGHDAGRLFWPMVSDDGSTVALIAVHVAMDGQSVLHIYQGRNHESVLVRALQLSDLWTRPEIHPNGSGLVMFTDASPEWFAGGSFSFSADSQLLLYRTQFGDQVHIRHSDGVVSPVRP